MEWDEKCCIGFTAVDTEREELFSTIRKLVNKSFSRSPENIVGALKAAAKYASQIFPIEEELMRDAFYPRLIDHQEEHLAMKREVSAYLELIRENDLDRVEEIVCFLLKWLDQHLLGSDVMFARYRNELHCQQEENVRIQHRCELRRKPIEKIQKLKHLFKEKLISIEDFKERKIKIFAEHLNILGLGQLKLGLSDLEEFQKNDHLSEKERKAVIQEFLSKLDLEKSLSHLPEVEEKLILLNSFYECELVAEPVYLDFKDKVLSQI